MKFEVSSNLTLSPADVSGLLTLQGVNRELGPFIRMTAPPAWSGKPIWEWPVGRVLFSSWILLFGIFPIDRHSFFLQSVDRQSGFAETSSSLINRSWRHRRTIDRNGPTCRLTDVVEFQCRLPVLAYVAGPVYRLIFKHRHRVLRSCYGGASCADG